MKPKSNWTWNTVCCGDFLPQWSRQCFVFFTNDFSYIITRSKSRFSTHSHTLRITSFFGKIQTNRKDEKQQIVKANRQRSGSKPNGWIRQNEYEKWNRTFSVVRIKKQIHASRIKRDGVWDHAATSCCCYFASFLFVSLVRKLFRALAHWNDVDVENINKSLKNKYKIHTNFRIWNCVFTDIC